MNKPTVEVQKAWIIGLIKYGEQNYEYVKTRRPDHRVSYARSPLPELLGYIESARAMLDPEDLKELDKSND